MQTLILPGGSIHNKEWAEEMQKQLSASFPVAVAYWKHWSGQKDPDWIEQEAETILQKYALVNVVAKSIGTCVLVHALEKKVAFAQKIILCGVPLTDLTPEDKNHYRVLKDVSPENILCLQNENDPHGSFVEVEQFIHAINPKVRVIAKPRSDHEYPYADNFLNFLK